MTNLTAIDQKIAELKRKKEQLRLRAADTLYRRCETLLGEHFSPEIVMGMVAEYQNASAAQRDKWQKVGATFFRPAPAQKNTAVSVPAQPAGTDTPPPLAENAAGSQ